MIRKIFAAIAGPFRNLRAQRKKAMQERQEFTKKVVERHIFAITETRNVPTYRPTIEKKIREAEAAKKNKGFWQRLFGG